MTVNINRKDSSPYNITTDQMEVGKAYEDDDGDIYICNRYANFVAFSICGAYVVHKDNIYYTKFREVTLNIEVV